jgi:quercetin dioxygenase-like cupin family protein
MLPTGSQALMIVVSTLRDGGRNPPQVHEELKNQEVGRMARAGERLYNPIQGDWMVFRETSRDTGGELLRAELIVSPHGENPLHVHPYQEERFEALSGTLGIQKGDEHGKLKEGEEATVPPGTPHRWWNDDDQEEARVLVEFRPALNTEIYFETLYGSTRDGKIDEKGPSFLLQHAVTLTGVNKGEFYRASPPVPVQKLLLAALAPVGRMLGYRDHYPRYSGAEAPGAEGAGPPSSTEVMARMAVIATALSVATLFLLRRIWRCT